MAALTKQSISRAGLTPTYAAVAASDTFAPGQNTFIHVKNAGGTIDNVVISVLAGDPPGLTIADVAVSVPITTGEKMIGPLPATFFADPTTGQATVTHSFITTVTAGVFDLSQP